jgi:acyl-coenzyme A synthetase/AMP-(fatty) acid ligase
VAFGIEDENSGTEEVVLVAEVNTEDAEERQKIAETLRVHVSKNSAVILRHTYIVSAKWILKTSSGKTARSANREKFLSEMNIA